MNYVNKLNLLARTKAFFIAGNGKNGQIWSSSEPLPFLLKIILDNMLK